MISCIPVIKHRALNGALRQGNRGRILAVDCKGHKAPSAKRCIKTGRRSRHRCACCHRVIKHRAPNGALRLHEGLHRRREVAAAIKHQAPNGALRLVGHDGESDRAHVIKHRAPNGALRPVGRELLDDRIVAHVIKHRAPNGALRLHSTSHLVLSFRLVIKHRATNGALRHAQVTLEQLQLGLVIKHRAPSGALRLVEHRNFAALVGTESLSNERQTVH